VIRSMDQVDIYNVLKIEDRDLWQVEFDPIEEAVRSYNSASRRYLEELLDSPNQFVQRRGLSIFSEIGTMGVSLIDNAIAHLHHKSLYARSHLLDGFLCYPERLRCSHLEKLLQFSNEVEPLIRSKLVIILGCTSLKRLEEAVFKTNDFVTISAFRKVYHKLSSDRESLQLRFDSALLGGQVAFFEFSKIIYDCRHFDLCGPISYSDDDMVGKVVNAFLKRGRHRTCRPK